MSIEDNKQVITDFFTLANQGNMEACIELLHDDLSWTVKGSTALSRTYSPKAAVLNELVGPLFGQLKAGIHMDIQRMIGEGDSVAVVANGTAETLEGIGYNNQYCHIVRIADGKIREVGEYLDTALVNDVFGAS